MSTANLTKLANENPDLKEVYESAIAHKATKHQNKSLEEYKVDAQAVIDKLSARLDDHKYLAADQMTLADVIGSVFVQWAIWNNKLVPGTHNIPKNLNIWFSEISNKKFFMMTYNRPKPHFIVDLVHGLIKKRMGMACGAFTLVIIAIAAVIFFLTRGPGMLQAQVVLMNEGGGTGVAGTIMISQKRMGGSRLTGTVTGLTEGKHGFHIHTDLVNPGDSCSVAGGHYNPATNDHAGPSVEKRHVGDLGNIVADASGTAIVDIEAPMVFIDKKGVSVLGRSIVIHADADDLGLGGATSSTTTGNAGARVACGTIVKYGQGGGRRGPPGKGRGPPGKG